MRQDEGDFKYWSYGYDAEGQLTSAKHYWYDGKPVPGQQFEFDYDDIGNRLTSSEGGDASGTGLRQSSYVPNDLNQYSSRSINAADRKADVMGLALVQNGVPTTVTIQADGGTAVAPDYRRGEYFWKAVAAGGSGPNWLNVNVVDGSSSSSGNVYVPPQSESYTPDADGNVIGDARWVYKWDAENRLARMDTQASAAAAGIPAKRIQYTYDYQGRMIRRQVFSGTYSAGAITWNSTPDTAPGSDLIFLYDGFQCIAALNSADQSLYQAYVWGLDASGSLSGAGGVGGLLMFRTTSQTYFPTYDGNGNVMGLVNGSDGTVVARYEYGPFGNLLRVTGEPVALDNPFRFSSKWQDDQSDLVYYGFRWYSPYNGRWLSRDPIEEQGGYNLYGFVFNNPYSYVDRNGFDSLGLWDRPPNTDVMGNPLPGNPRYVEYRLKTALAFDVSLAFAAGATWDNATRLAYSAADAKLKDGIRKLVGEGVLTVHDGAEMYVRRRNELVKLFRDRSTPLGKYIAEKMKPSSKLPTLETLYEAGKTDESILAKAAANKIVTGNVSKIAKGAKICAYVTIAIDLYEVVKAEPSQRPKLIAKKVGGFAGAAGGAWALGEGGGEIGTALGGPPGGVLGAAGGVIIGGIGGAFIGETVSEQVFDAIVDH